MDGGARGVGLGRNRGVGLGPEYWTVRSRRQLGAKVGGAVRSWKMARSKGERCS